MGKSDIRGCDFLIRQADFTEFNIPVIYYRIQLIGYPTVLICSLIWMNRAFFPGEAKFVLISIALFLVEWLGIDRLIVH